MNNCQAPQQAACGNMLLEVFENKEVLRFYFSDVGDKGLSAYEVAVQEGFVGTIDEWLESLVGPPVPVTQELGDDPDLAVSQKLLKDSIDSMKQSNSEVVAEAERLNNLSQQAASSAAESELNASTSAEHANSSALSAAQSASESEASAELAAEKATETELNATRAETARDAAFINADVYPDVASGLAAVAVGEQFQVLSADGLEYVRYRHDAGGVAAEIGEGFPSPKGVESAVEEAIEISFAPEPFRRLFRLFNPSRPYSETRRSGAILDFRDRSALFQDAAGTTPVTEYGQPVGLVVDRSGNGNHLFQQDPAARPTYGTDDEGIPCLIFDGVNTWLDSNIIDPLLQRTQLFVCALNSNEVREQMVLSSAGAASSGNGLRHSYYPGGAAGSPFRFTIYRGAAGAADSTVVSLSDVTNKAMLGMTWDGTTDPERLQIYRNNIVVAKKQAAQITTSQLSPLRVGNAAAPSGFGNAKLNGRIYGMLLFSDFMTEEEVLTFSEYMGTYIPASGGGESSVFSGVLVAAANAPDEVKALANVVCSGVDDHIIIQQQLNQISAGMRVFLSEGQFGIGGTIVIPDAKGILGAGKTKTTLKLQDHGQRLLSDLYWRSAGGRMQTIMHTDFVDEAGQRELYWTSGILLSGFSIVGNTDAALPDNGRLMGLLVTSCRDSVVSDVDVLDINWFEPAAIDPSKGFGIVTRYTDNVDVVRCSPSRAQYECLGMYDNSNNTRFIDCYPGDAGRTSMQIHRGCIDSSVIRGRSKNTSFIRAADEKTKGLTVHGVPTNPIINLRVVDHDVTCTGLGTGDAISWFGAQEGCSYRGKAYSQNGFAASFDGNTEGFFDLDGEFTSDSIGSNYALIVRGTGIRTGRVVVNGQDCSGIAVWGASDIRLEDFDINCFGDAINISTPNNVRLKRGVIKSLSGFGIRCLSSSIQGVLQLFDIDIETASKQCILFDGTVADGDSTSIKDVTAKRLDGGEAVRLQHSGATFESNNIAGVVAVDNATGIKIRFNQYGGITFTGTTENENIVKYNEIISP